MKHYTLYIIELLIFFCCASCSDDEVKPTPDPLVPETKDALSYYSYHELNVSIGQNSAEQLKIPYRLLDPTEAVGAPSDKTYPLVIFLHGIGERGTDGMSHMAHGYQYFFDAQEQYPCFVAYPQCPPEYYWSYPSRPWPMSSESMNIPNQPTPMYDAVISLADELAATYPVDKDRIVLVGFSAGALGALDIAARSEDAFAGVVSIAGGINMSRLPDLLKMRVWLEHCLDDVSLSPELTLTLANALPNYPQADVTVKIYPAGGHIGFHLFNTFELMEWIVCA
ncbi:MAG: prolyl oligopeptidase family serine peptidase [Prevotella sp.]|nr:prolyl oligopeptidase family serine peptidase [Prevotella sp.]MCM1075215.1 prolyl oligopeptidase family serine peptidase [Ruminococcus sp.]